MPDFFIHDSAEVHDHALIKSGTSVWNWTKIREHVEIGHNCNIGQCVYVDLDVKIGDRCKIQNGVQIYKGVSLGDDIFVGPNATFTNDKVPRADNQDWQITPTIVEDGVSIGAGSVIVCGVTLGERCMIAAGSVVTKDVPPYALVMGVPGNIIDYVDAHGNRLNTGSDISADEYQKIINSR